MNKTKSNKKEEIKPKIIQEIVRARLTNGYLVNLDSGKVCNEDTCMKKTPLHISLEYKFFSNNGLSFSMYCEEMVRRRKKAENMQKEHKKKKEVHPLSKKIRLAVWNKRFGNFPRGRCFSCTTTIYYSAWHCGHILARDAGGKDSLDNLVPLCEKCNLSMSDKHMYIFMLANGMPGCKNIPDNDSIYKKYKPLLQEIGPIIDCISKREREGIIPGGKAKEYRKIIYGGDIENKLDLIKKFS